MSIRRRAIIERAHMIAEPQTQESLPLDSKKRKRKKGETRKVSFPLRGAVFTRTDVVGPMQGGPGIVETTINGSSPL